jgi:HSP90 family molecular chaperone
MEVPLISGRPSMKNARVIFDVDDGNLKVRVHVDEVKYNVFDFLQHPKDKEQCFRIDVLDELYSMELKQQSKASPLEKALIDTHSEGNKEEEKEIERFLKEFDASNELKGEEVETEKLPKAEKDEEIKP